MNSIIMKCFERDPAKRLDVKGIIKYQDSLEMINYGDFMSQLNFESILAASQSKCEVVQRALYDTTSVDYTNKTLDLRNNPWFFNKDYSYTDRHKHGDYPVEKKNLEAIESASNKLAQEKKSAPITT